MKEGQTKTGYITSDEGYGNINESFIYTIPLEDSVAMFETYDRVEFESKYDATQIDIGAVYEDPYWGWNVRIEAFTDNTVEIQHQPKIGSELNRFEWPVQVVNLSSATGLIWLKHSPDKSIVNTPIHAEVMEFYNPTLYQIRQNIINTQQPYPGIIISIQNGK